MNDRQDHRDTIRLAARVYTLAAGVLGVLAGMSAFSILAAGPNITSVLSAIALLVVAAVVVITLLVAANLFLTLINAAEDIETQTHLLRKWTAQLTAPQRPSSPPPASAAAPPPADSALKEPLGDEDVASPPAPE